MLKLSPLQWLNGGNLQRRFIMRVLAPPFLILAVLGIIVLVQLGRFLRNEAINSLNRAATSTAAKLEREFAIRQTVLRRTGEELFVIKSEYQTTKQQLDKKRDACGEYLKARKTFQGAPDGICDPFLPEFAGKGATLEAIEDSYVRNGEELTKDQTKKISEKLDAYKQFFPEALALIVADDKHQLVSSALSDLLIGSEKALESEISSAAGTPIEGKIQSFNETRVAIFIYPLATGGSVMAAYDVTSDTFMKQTWESTPIDRNKAIAIIMSADGQLAYPPLDTDDNFSELSTRLRQSSYAEFTLKNLPQIAVGVEAGSSEWLVAVASSKITVFRPLRNAQIAASVIIGSLLVAFLWVGSIFIHRTVSNILHLVSGALFFASGRLDYKIKLGKSDKEFIQLADTLNNMSTRIAAAEKELDEKNKEFISIATHELRTPLTAILGNLSIASEDLASRLDAVVKPVIEQAYRGTLRMRDLVNDMLDMARLEGGRVEFVMGPQDMVAIAKEVVDTLQVTANEKNVSLEYLPDHAVIVQADAGKLRIVLNNFVSNAIKYNRSGGTVRIFHEIKGGQVVTAIADSGLGIPDDQKAHMFEKFFRVQHEDRQTVTGTGLGMYITRRYVESMGGKVWFESTHGEGTTFYFSLPIAIQTQTHSKSEEADPRVPAVG